MAKRGLADAGTKAIEGKSGSKSSRTPGIGKGLSAILSEARSEGAAGELREVPPTTIQANPDQPRRRFDPAALEALKQSVQASGIIQPLLVRPLPDGRYELIAGERRLRAATEVGLESVPVVIRDPAEEERLQQALIENMVREDLNPVEEARACEALVRELGLSKQEVSQRIGRSRPALSNLIRLLELPDEVLELLEEGDLSEGHGRAILAVEDHDLRREVARAAVKGGWSVRRTEQEAREPAKDSKRAERRPALSTEEQEALRQAGERLEAALGQEVRVRPRGKGIAVEIGVADYEELLAFAELLEHRR